MSVPRLNRWDTLFHSTWCVPCYANGRKVCACVVLDGDSLCEDCLTQVLAEEGEDDEENCD